MRAAGRCGRGSSPPDERQRVPSHPQGSPPAASLHETGNGGRCLQGQTEPYFVAVWLLLLLLALSVGRLPQTLLQQDWGIRRWPDWHSQMQINQLLSTAFK